MTGVNMTVEETNNCSCYLALDLGAESGRVMAGIVSDSEIELKELHRFANRVDKFPDGTMHWRLEELLANCELGIRKAAEAGLTPKSVSVDSWGTDYVMLDNDGNWILPGHCYRDSRTARGLAKALEHISLEELYAETGIQHMPLNTVFQVMADPPEKLEVASLIFGVGDAINYMLGGRPVYEASMASTSQFYNPESRSWSEKVISRLGLKRSMFQEIVPSGTAIGTLRSDLVESCGWSASPPAVMATCSHDTGCAVAAVPAGDENWAYLSSGTWSLMGIELPSPILSDACRKFNFTNEVGLGHSIRLLKNISGMWLIQECRREWSSQGHSLSYAEMSQLAEKSQPFRSLIDPSSDVFLSPESMTGAIENFCRETHQPVPESMGEFIRCALDSLALLYRRTLEQLESLTDKKIEKLHIVGGGSQNHLLNQLAADVSGIPVIAGPVEATALGNVLIQHAAANNQSLADIRMHVKNSIQLEEFSPSPSSSIDSSYQKFLSLTS